MPFSIAMWNNQRVTCQQIWGISYGMKNYWTVIRIPIVLHLYTHYCWFADIGGPTFVAYHPIVHWGAFFELVMAGYGSLLLWRFRDACSANPTHWGSGWVFGTGKLMLRHRLPDLFGHWKGIFHGHNWGSLPHFRSGTGLWAPRTLIPMATAYWKSSRDSSVRLMLPRNFLSSRGSEARWAVKNPQPTLNPPTHSSGNI